MRSELADLQIQREIRKEIKSIREEERATDAAQDKALAQKRRKLATLESRQASLRQRVKSDKSLEPQIERLRAEIGVAERQIRVRQSARTVSNFNINTRNGAGAEARQPTLLEGVQASIDYSRSGKAKKAAFEEYERRELKKRQAAAVRSLNLSDDQLDEFRAAFSQFDRDGDGHINTRELATVMRMLGDNPSVVEIASLAAQMDSDGSGEIEFGEFVELMAVKKGYCQKGTKLSAADAAFLEGTDPLLITSSPVRYAKNSRNDPLEWNRPYISYHAHFHDSTETDDLASR